MLAELDELPALRWMPSRIPIRDALVAFVAAGEEPPKLPFQAGELRWYEVPGGARMAMAYDGQAVDISGFQIAKGFWDHTTCDWCAAHIKPMDLCYVTESGTYVGLCCTCYSTYVASKLGVIRRLLWRAKRKLGIHAAA